MFFLIYASRIVEQGSKSKYGVLPQGFKSVLYSDVFAWLRGEKPSSRISPCLPPDILLQHFDRNESNDPADEAIKYEHGQPVPMRVDDLPCASQRPVCMDVPQEFDPLSFAPSLESTMEQDEELRSAEATWQVGSPGDTPCKVFFGALFMFGCLWLICGIFVTAEFFNMTTFVVPPLLVGSEKTLHSVESWPEVRHHILEGGHEVATHWPQAAIHVHGLACDAANQRIVASTRFGVYVAKVEGSDGQPASRTLQFHAAPLPSDIRGKPLQDVAILCASGKCDGFALNQGNWISSLGVASPSAEHQSSDASAQRLSAKSVSDDWLHNGVQADDGQLESLVALAAGVECTGGSAACAVIGTSANRILEMQLSGDTNSAGGPELFPRRLLWTTMSDVAELSSGSLHVMNERYLGVLLSHSQRLEILDLSNGSLRLQMTTRLMLPESKHWSAMCAMGDNFVLLDQSASPQLWFFPVPEQLRKNAPSPWVASGVQETRSVSKRRLRIRPRVEAATDLEGILFDEPAPALSLLQHKALAGRKTKPPARRMDVQEQVADGIGAMATTDSSDRDTAGQFLEL